MSLEAETTDQAPQQSVEDKILSRLGLPSQAEEATAVDQTTEETQQAVDDAFADIEWEGQTIKVPKGLKEAVMRTDDYTRKTQELADQRRSIEQLRETLQTRQTESAFAESIAPEQQEISVIDAYLSQIGKLDWSAMTAEQMLRQRIELDSIKERRQSLQDSIASKRSKFTTDMQAKLNELRGKSRELASKSIQGFSEETEKAMREYAKTEGLTDPELDNVLLDPRSYKIVYKAMQFDKVKAGTGKVKQAVERVLKPGAASERMPADTANRLNFNKAMKAAGKDSGAKARVIEDRLVGIFSRGHK
jgi:hypothetical protein